MNQSLTGAPCNWESRIAWACLGRFSQGSGRGIDVHGTFGVHDVFDAYRHSVQRSPLGVRDLVQSSCLAEYELGI